MGTCLFSIAKQTCGFVCRAQNNLKPLSNCLFWCSFSFYSSFWVSKKSFINPQKPAYFGEKTPFWAHSATHKNPKVEKCANRQQIVGLWPPLFPDLNFLLLWGQTGKKSCSQNALFFVLRKRAWLGCFSAYIYCRFLRSKITKKKLSYFAIRIDPYIRFEFPFVMGSDWEKKLLSERIFMFGHHLWFMFGHGCFYCKYTVGFEVKEKVELFCNPYWSLCPIWVSDHAFDVAWPVWKVTAGQIAL